MGFALVLVGCAEPVAPKPVERSPQAEQIDALDAPPTGGCPSDAVVGHLHAAAFHFEHGDASRARERLTAAERILPPFAQRDTGRILGALRQIAKDHAADPTATRTAVEEVRAQLTDWGCLTEGLHARLHQQLDATHALPQDSAQEPTPARDDQAQRDPGQEP
ncbi:MAG: hypothetical protein K0V04_45345 [Deltaproteobacteria bacterium]|nr:hypothetical protein [Deltaproteobacteria bacterium]